MQPEESVGINGDVNFKTSLGDWGFFRINQLFFYNRINETIILRDTSVVSGIYELANITGYTEAKGFETSMKFGFGAFTLFAGYTYTNAVHIFKEENEDKITTPLTLTPTHNLKGDLLFDDPGKWQLAVDYEYKSSQFLSNGRKTNDFIWICGAQIHRQMAIVCKF